jgi:hypothetical protein
MTSEAIKQSSAITASPNTNDVLKRLGLIDRSFALGGSYVDIGALLKRDVTSFERGVINSVGATDITGITLPGANSIPGWILRGAIREDDNTLETPQGSPAGDEPGGVFSRVFGHFFDPVNNRGLTVLGNNVGPRSPDWAIVKDSVVNGPLNANRKNYYNWPSAREAMWRALTLKAWNNGALSDAVDPANWPNKTREELRQAYWATMFRSIGDVVHVLQDAAQPQHTRNDPHSGLGCVALTGVCALGHASFVEYYFRARTLMEPRFVLEEGFISTSPRNRVEISTPRQLPYLGYTKPSFAKPEEFFSTATGSDNAAGKGLANYSNRGFYSFGTNVSRNVFPSPPQYGEGLGTEIIDGDDPNPDKRLRSLAGVELTGTKLAMRTGTVTDTVFGGTETKTGVRLTTQGYWDQFLGEQSAFRQFTLNHYNYDEQARLLIPRAVAYSAGLIDFFFRGQIEIFPPAEGVYGVLDHSLPSDNCMDNCGFRKVKMKLANSTPAINPSGGGAAVAQAMGAGQVVAVAKYRLNICYTADLSGEFDSSLTNETATQYLNRCRSAFEEIAVSQPVAVFDLPACDRSVAGQCEGAARQLSFTFVKPIPVNATDLYLQAVFRGNLGSEADAVVVTTKDIGEPTYFAVVNVTDFFVCHDNAFYYKSAGGALPGNFPVTTVDGQSAEDYYAAGNYSTWRLAFQPNEGSLTNPLVRVDNLAPRTFARIAVLTEAGRRFNDEIEGYRNPKPAPFTLVNTAVSQTTYLDNNTASTLAADYWSAKVRKVRANVPLAGYRFNLTSTVGDCSNVTRGAEPDYPAPTTMKEAMIAF